MAEQKLKIYLDTSVISVFDDFRIPQRQAQTREFWKTLKNFKVYVSEITIQEISNIPNLSKKNRLLTLTKQFEILKITDEAKQLANAYLEKGIIPAKYINDALHLAIATINNCTILVSWNCTHLINLRTKREANKVNLANRYKEIELVEPPMVKL